MRPKIGVGINVKELNARPWQLKTYYYIGERADAVGLDFLACPNMVSRGMAGIETFSYLTTMINKTHWVKIGTFVCQVPLYNPIILASRIASLDVVSEGRFIFGAGTGWFRPEVEGTFGIPWNERWQWFDEDMDIITKLWSQDKVTYDGKHYKLKDAVTIKPLQQPHPPIWVGGTSDTALEMVAKYGDGWAGLNYPFWTSKKQRVSYSIQERLNKLSEFCRKYGRDPDKISIGMFMHMNISSSREKAIADATDHYVGTRGGRVGGGGPMDHQVKWGVWGTADLIIDGIKEYEKVGADTVVLWPMTRDLKGQWDRIEREVLPSL